MTFNATGCRKNIEQWEPLEKYFSTKIEDKTGELIYELL